MDVDYSFLMTELERQEFENEKCSSRVYEQLLVMYLANNDYPNAKFLWKRAPANIKEESQELIRLWEIGKKLIQNDIPTVYEAIDSYTWPEHLSKIVKFLRDEIKKRALQLIGKSYSTICFEDFMKFTGLTNEEEVVTLAESLNWKVDPTFGIEIPKKTNYEEDHTSNQEQLEKMTEYVAFLENY